MIRYTLACERRHEFESWFANSSAYDKQAKRGLVACPICGSTKVEKAIIVGHDWGGIVAWSFAMAHPDIMRSISNPGPHGLSEILYAFSSGAANNGSATDTSSASVIEPSLSVASSITIPPMSLERSSGATAASWPRRGSTSTEESIR